MSPALLPDGFQSRFADTAGTSLHYVVGGSGAPLLLLHGWPLTWYSWRKVMPQLATRYRVIAPDLPGLGDSGPSPHGYAKAAVARVLNAFLGELCGPAPIHLIGHDMGVPIAYALARQFPTRVEKLAVLDVPIQGFGLKEFAQRLHLWHFDFFHAPGLAESLIAGRERAWIEHFYPNSFDREEYARTYTVPGALLTSLAYYRTFAEDEAWNVEMAKTKLDMPVLALGGEYAGGAAPFACFAQLAKHVQGGIIPGCGHYLAEEKPEGLARELLRFFDDAKGQR